jgi:hypothetical protein
MLLCKTGQRPYTQGMTIEQTVEIPADRRLLIEVPREVPAGRAILTLTPQNGGASAAESGERRTGIDALDDAEARRQIEELKRGELPRPQTVEEAVKQAGEQAAKPGRAPISSYFGIMKDHPLPQSGAEYQRGIRDEWD